MQTRQDQQLSYAIPWGNSCNAPWGGTHDLNYASIIRVYNSRPFRADDDRPNSKPTVSLGNGPLKSDSMGCTPICGVNTSLVVAQMSNPAEPEVALWVSEVAAPPDPAMPHTFEGPGDVGPSCHFLNLVD